MNASTATKTMVAKATPTSSERASRAEWLEGTSGEVAGTTEGIFKRRRLSAFQVVLRTLFLNAHGLQINSESPGSGPQSRSPIAFFPAAPICADRGREVAAPWRGDR